MAKQTFNLGTAVKITSTVSLAGADSMVITVEDPLSAIKVNEVAMTQDADTVWSYIYQSATTDTAGTYEVTIKATYGDYTALSKAIFELEE